MTIVKYLNLHLNFIPLCYCIRNYLSRRIFERCVHRMPYVRSNNQSPQHKRDGPTSFDHDQETAQMLASMQSLPPTVLRDNMSFPEMCETLKSYCELSVFLFLVIRFFLYILSRICMDHMICGQRGRIRIKNPSGQSLWMVLDTCLIIHTYVPYPRYRHSVTGHGYRVWVGVLQPKKLYFKYPPKLLKDLMIRLKIIINSPALPGFPACYRSRFPFYFRIVVNLFFFFFGLVMENIDTPQNLSTLKLSPVISNLGSELSERSSYDFFCSVFF
jgi:hypothetical protein